MAFAAAFVFSFPDNIYVEYAKVNTGDTPSEYSKYESGTSVYALSSQRVYYKIYSLLENRDDRIIITGPHSPNYNLEVPENEIVSVDGADWILREWVGYDGVSSKAYFEYKVFILIPDDEPDNPGDESDKEESSDINFTYDKTPKFREQETPHVYFDTVKGSRTETRTYTYADGTVTGNFNGPPIKKVLDFTSPDRLDGWTLIFNNGENGESEWDLHANDFGLDSNGYYKFMGRVLGKLIIAEGPIDISDVDFEVTIPESGVYITDRLTLVGEVAVASNEGPFASFSKNVTVKAHTEYTAHINGRIGESGGVLNGYSFSKIGNWRLSDYSDIQVANCDGSFETAKAALLAGKKVIGFIDTSSKPNSRLAPYLFDTIVEDFWGSGLTGIKVDIGVRYSCLLASDNKLYLHHAE